MAFVINDRWAGSFPLTRITRYVYTIRGWRDLFASWRYEVAKKHDADRDLSLELRRGDRLIEAAAGGPRARTKKAMQATARGHRCGRGGRASFVALMLDESFGGLDGQAWARTNLSPTAVSSRSWSAGRAPSSPPGTSCCRARMADDPKVATAPSRCHREAALCPGHGLRRALLHADPPDRPDQPQGRNNSLTPGPDDPGSPYAIGAAEGGHDALHPELGSFEDFQRPWSRRRTTTGWRSRSISPSSAPRPSLDQGASGVVRLAAGRHDQICREPAQEVRGHRQRPFLPRGPAGDLVRARDSVLFWIDKGVKIFRVDNPHTKPFPVLGVDDPRGPRPFTPT
jgi:starch synthase (maltosyl-transferring)